MTLIGILGSSASGKSALALEIAECINAEIFSLDSLGIYRQINIASAKPKQHELARIKHYGINELDITEHNNAIIFKTLLENAIQKTSKKTLLITGGSSFYLKSIIEGLSPMPQINDEQKQKLQDFIKTQKDPHQFLSEIDPLYSLAIKPNDSYRIHKALEIFFSTQTPPSLYFKNNPKIPFSYPIKLYSIAIPKEALRENIKIRSAKMIQEGIIEEIACLIQKYPRDSQPFKAIGPKECISYLDGNISIKALEEEICIHTNQLAKRQSTFNRTQFQNISHLSPKEIFNAICQNTR
ncbi:tRNA (adenosine(37)-N6)-dimethylallyltransferase MiaA [Helicobacter sp. 12S02232-10]|nr:tRNA (adenosine(37)-N6)-dimethylallyltransferase MiaA [Helicobacter sp. 12S02232-10]